MILVLSVLFDALARWVERRTLVWQTAGRRERASARAETMAGAPAPA
jgi:NitT/TauT family transport system permease protein